MSRKLPQSKHRCERCGAIKPRAEMCVSPNNRIQPVCKVCSVPPPGMKWCSMHHTWEPVEGFGYNRANPDGLASICREGKAAVDERRRANAPAGAVRADDVNAMNCEQCTFQKRCREMTSAAYRQTWAGNAPDLGATVELPCVPAGPGYAEYVEHRRARRAEKAAKARPVTINNVVCIR